MTKRRLVLVTLFVLSAVFISSSLGASVNVSGVWNMDILWNDTGVRSHGVCTLKQNDPKLSGTCEAETGGAIPIVAGEVNGQKTVWEISRIENDGERHSAKFAGDLDASGTGLSGTVDFDGALGTFTATKQ
jgi:hypothetical protein